MPENISRFNSADNTQNLALQKTACRRQAAALRNHLASLNSNAADQLASHAKIVVDKFGRDQQGNNASARSIIAGYMPIRSELSPLGLITALVELGYSSALPITPPPITSPPLRPSPMAPATQDQPLQFHQWAPGDALEDGPYHTKQPSFSAPQIVPDIILAPMLAFDAQGWRLGYGGGYYDRTMAQLRTDGYAPVMIGIAYEGQRLDKLPVGPYDMRLDAVLCPSGFYSG